MTRATRQIGSIERRAQSWRVVWRRDGQRFAESFLRESEAVAFREQLTANGGHYPEGWGGGVGVVAGGRTVADVFAEYVATEVTPSSREYVANRFRTRVVERGHPIAKQLIAEVTADDVTRFLTDLGEQFAENTIMDLVGRMRSAFRYAIDRGYMAGPSPFPRRMARVESAYQTKDPVYLQRDEVGAIVAALPDRYRLFARLLFGSGLRVGEAYALRVRSVRVGADGRVTLTVDKSAHLGTDKLGPTKNRKTRHVALSMPLSVEVATLAADRPPRDRLFTIPRYRQFYDVWADAVAAAGLLDEHPRGVRIHDTRHTHASDLIMAGVPLLKVSRRLGHSSIRITADIYGGIHADDAALFRDLDDLAA